MKISSDLRHGAGHVCGSTTRYQIVSKNVRLNFNFS